ncbi:hypothetical protein [Zoogloea sp. LCSB751]|uniref:hypothetical protein n=1 Tax=Zoogloea sp. LCSB751 TaxID=1965277 RepID=UPI0009A4745C|nr:hypothetical protein [Zoogloea sp. LCSB751]
MRFLPLLLALFCCNSFADVCDELPKPSVTVKLHEEPVGLGTVTGLRTLSLMGPRSLQEGQRVLGLTRGAAIVRFETRVVSRVDASRQWECASPQISVTYGFSPLTVYVAKEFPKDSCAYREIYQHEQRHVDAYRQHLAGIEKELADTLSRRFTTGGPWRGPIGQARTRIANELEERWGPYVRREINKVELVQAQIDTPEEYRRVAERCDGAIKKITLQALQR